MYPFFGERYLADVTNLAMKDFVDHISSLAPANSRLCEYPESRGGFGARRGVHAAKPPGASREGSKWQVWQDFGVRKVG